MDFSAAPAPFLPSAGAEAAVPWPRWVKMFDSFLLAIGGDEYTPARKRAVLLTCLGAEGQRVFDSLPVAVKVEGEDDFQFATRRLKAHFEPKVNVCGERYRFRSRAQQQGETVLQWVGVLRQLARPVRVIMLGTLMSLSETRSLSELCRPSSVNVF